MTNDTSAMSLRFWGVRGSLPTPGPDTMRYGGNTLCVALHCGPHLLILDAGSGAQRWRASVQGAVWSSAAVAAASRLVYVGTQASTLIALDVDTGDHVFSVGAKGAVDASPAVSDSCLIFADGGGWLVKLCG